MTTKFVAVVLHLLEQRFDGFLPEVVFAAADEGVRFVNKEHAAQRGADRSVRLGRRLPDIAPPQARRGPPRRGRPFEECRCF